MKTLFLAWQAPDRGWYPVGRLLADPAQQWYQFVYTKGALDARQRVGFEPLFAFPDFDQTYVASELFPLFRNRVMSSGRKDFGDYLRSLDLNPDNPDLLDVLAVTGGERQTDSLEVFPKIQMQADGSFHCRFFLHGSRYVNLAGIERAKSLRNGEPLKVLVETNNPATGVALLLSSEDYLPLGWAPRYLVRDLLEAMSSTPQLKATVVKVNAPDVPANRRYLIELSGQWPHGVAPMSGENFQPIH